VTPGRALQSKDEARPAYTVTEQEERRHLCLRFAGIIAGGFFAR
jgi:hypothetical protein